MFIGDQNKSLPRRVERKSEHDHRWVTNDESQCTYVTSILGYTRIHHPQGHMFHVNYSHTVKHSSDQNVLGDKGTDNYYPSIQNYIWKERKTNIYCSTMTSFIIWLYQQCHDKTPDIFQFVQVYCQINYGHHSQVISCIYTSKEYCGNCTICICCSDSNNNYFFKFNNFTFHYFTPYKITH